MSSHFTETSSHFIETSSLLDSIAAAKPRFEHFDPFKGEPNARGKRLDWFVDGSYAIAVPSENVLFMQGNLWNVRHAAAILQHLRGEERTVLPAPCARVYRIDADRVKRTQKMSREELSYQYGMTRPWEKKDVGSYFAQLIDGNHRALAAMAYGEPAIVVEVGENYRSDVRKKDYLRLR